MKLLIAAGLVAALTTPSFATDPNLAKGGKSKTEAGTTTNSSSSGKKLTDDTTQKSYKDGYKGPGGTGSSTGKK